MNVIPKRRSSSNLSGSRRCRPFAESLESRRLLSTFIVNNTSDSGPGSLRQAISSSDGATGQTNVIIFRLGNSSVVAIDLLSPLPVITQSVTIEGATDSSGNPLVELNGGSAGSTADGLVIQAINTTISGLVIEQFGGDGIDVSGSNDVIAGNDIGIPDITTGDGNGGSGVVITGSNDEIVRTAAGYGNYITGNLGSGVWITGSSATGNVVQGNNLGLGMSSGNTGDGILIDAGASNNLIGTNGDGVNDGLEANVISGNASWGVQISGSGTQENVIAGNKIGTGVHGAAAIPNAEGGVLIDSGASNNLIGTDGSSTHADEGNQISGNNDAGAPGIMITDAGTDSNVVAGNLIGTDASGEVALGNGGVGVFILNGAQSNVIGTNGDGRGDLTEQNVISGNAYQGVYIGGTETNDNIVAGNLIGVDEAGTTAMGNGNNGIWIADGAQSSRIGVNPGDAGAAAETNVIAANAYSGIRISDPGTNFNTVSGNDIGSNSDLISGLGNGDDGIQVANGAQSNTIGGSTALANNILFNTNNGVGVYDNATTGNSIRANSISRDAALGIDLGGDGVTPNHGNTMASGPNNLENYPIITSAGSGTTTTVGASFVGLPNASYTIDFYVTPHPNSSGYGEGNRWLGSVAVITNAAGQATGPMTFNLPAATNSGQWITATATDQAGNTSEFSLTWQLASLASQVTVAPSLTSPIYGQSQTFTATVAAFGSALPTPTGIIEFEVDGSPFSSAVTLVNGAATSISTTRLPAGNHTISAVYLGDSNYTADTGTTSQTVAFAPLTITAVNQSKVYGAADPVLAYKVSGLVNGDSQSVVSGVKTSTAIGAAATAGTHVITVSGGTAANYAITNVNGTLAVAKAAPLIITADDKSKVYGAADPTPSYTASGTLYYDDSYSVITGVTLATTTGADATAGTHAIMVSGGTAANYAITNVNGTLSVAKAAPLIVTADDKSKVYGAADPTLSYTPSGTLYYGDSYSVITGATLATTTGAAASAGTHTITVAGGNATNYAITDVNGTLTVSQAPLIVTVDNKTKVYGATDPTLTSTPSGTLFYGDSYSVITGVSLATTTGAAATAGTHAITAGGTAANYAITDVNATLTVSPAPLIVIADDKSKIYGAADPILSYTASGTLYYGDSYSVITGVSLATTTGAAATAGTHTITAVGGNAINYAIADVNGTLTVTPRPTVTMSNVMLVLNKKHMVAQVLIVFSGSINVADAQTVGIYRLATAGKNNSFDAKNAQVIKLKSAAYSAASNIVTLTPKKQFALTKTVQLRVNGQPPAGLHDSAGASIDGDHDGQPGGNAIALLHRSGATISAVPSILSAKVQPGGRHGVMGLL